MQIYGADCETDPFETGRIPKPFLWGIYGESSYREFTDIQDFMDFCAILERGTIIYFHNGGKFDVHFLLPYLDKTTAQIINGRIVKVNYKQIQFRDSFACAPAPLSATGDKQDFEYWKLEKEYRLKYSNEISGYLKQDCKALFDLMMRYHDKVGNKITVASNALNFAVKNLDIKIKKTTYLFDRKFREYYYGGRVEARQGGEFKDVSIYDIKSAYPYAMMCEHPHGNKYSEGKGYIKDAHFYKIKCHANNCFPQRIDGKLMFPVGYGEYNVSHWELEKAQEMGLVSDLEVLKSTKFHETITFKPYIDHWYAEKEKAEQEGNKRDRLISKFLLNSLYGKMAQDPLNFDEWVFKPTGSKIDHENGWFLSHILECFDGSHIEIHKRGMLKKFEEQYDDWQKENLYYNVATGASITGYVRAMMFEAIHKNGKNDVIYCDTDSIAIKKPANDLDMSGALGSWECEGKAKRMIICGKKLYGIEWQDGEKKISSKGAKLKFEDLEKINNGEIILWENEAPTFSLTNGIYFVSRKIQKTI